MDVIDLRDFYSRRLGIVARQLINRGIRERWPDAKDQRVLGIGYPTPYLGLFREDSERCIAFMPAAQGVLKWPTGRPALATLVEEFSLPLADAAIDRILLVHALEMSDDPEGLLREVWRVLAPSGRMIAIIPNRRGGWTRTDATPLGPRIEIAAGLRRRGQAFGPRAVRPAPPARETLAAAIAFKSALAAVDLRLRAGDERGQAVDPATVRDHRLRLRLLRLVLRLWTMLAVAVFPRLLVALIGLPLALMIARAVV